MQSEILRAPWGLSVWTGGLIWLLDTEAFEEPAKLPQTVEGVAQTCNFVGCGSKSTITAIQGCKALKCLRCAIQALGSGRLHIVERCGPCLCLR